MYETNLNLNLDSYVDEEDLLKTVVALTALAEYARIKAFAMRLRKDGLIEAALDQEKECERIYDVMPKEARW